jgi:hypothetical protein
VKNGFSQSLVFKWVNLCRYAMGLGATQRLPAAAAINWVLKDGLGRLGKLSVATNFGGAVHVELCWTHSLKARLVSNPLYP